MSVNMDILPLVHEYWYLFLCLEVEEDKLRNELQRLKHVRQQMEKGLPASPLTSHYLEQARYREEHGQNILDEDKGCWQVFTRCLNTKQSSYRRGKRIQRAIQNTNEVRRDCEKHLSLQLGEPSGIGAAPSSPTP